MRQAKVIYEDDWPWPGKPWPWPGKPWPWCPYAEMTFLTGITVPDQPHDCHMVNEGNTWCPGHPGEIDD
jgi:hypothetical protein